MTHTTRSPRRATHLALTLLLGVALTACGEASSPGTAPTTTDGSSAAPTAPAPDDAGSTTPEDAVRTSDLTPITPEPGRPGEAGALPTGPVPDAVADRPDVQTAVAAEAERRGVEVSDVEIAGWADVTWPDGSIGCPQPGMMYTQALVPGHQLVLRVGDELASYHAAQGKPFSYCANPESPTPGAATS